MDVPSIGPKTAKRLEKASIDTVADLLACDPDETVEQLRVPHLDAELIQEWQSQARLVCCVPNLRGHDAQILVACGVVDPDQLAAASLDELLALAREFVVSSEGKRILRLSAAPNREEVDNWIQWASRSRQLPMAA